MERSSRSPAPPGNALLARLRRVSFCCPIVPGCAIRCPIMPPHRQLATSCYAGFRFGRARLCHDVPPDAALTRRCRRLDAAELPGCARRCQLMPPRSQTSVPHRFRFFTSVAACRKAAKGDKSAESPAVTAIGLLRFAFDVTASLSACIIALSHTVLENNLFGHSLCSEASL